jgi:Flp pilus assembly protein TadG
MRVRGRKAVAAVRRRAATVRAAARKDRGDTSIQMAIVFPFVILLTVAVVQASMWYYARSIALTAAREGVNAGRGYQSSPGAGATRARSTLDRISGDSLRGTGVSTGGSTADTVEITVSGTAVSMLPGIPGLHISQSASAARERWTTP